MLFRNDRKRYYCSVYFEICCIRNLIPISLGIEFATTEHTTLITLTMTG